MDFSLETPLQNLLFETDPNENLTFEHDLIRNESEFQDFLEKISQNPEVPIVSLSLSFLPKKWAAKFFQNLKEMSAKHPIFAKLKKLRISHTNIPSETLIDLLKNIKSEILELNLSSNPLTISDNTIIELNKLENRKSLRTLILKNNKQITDKTLEILDLPNLICLNLSNCSITDIGLLQFNMNPCFSKLEVLNLSRNHEIQTFQELHLPKLLELEIAYCKLEADFVKNIIKSDFHSNLKVMNIGNLASYDAKSVFQEIVKGFVNNKAKFAKVEKLNLENVCVLDEDLGILLNLFENVKALNLNNNKFLTSGCFKALEQRKGNLRVLGLENCQISNENIDKFLDFNMEMLGYLNLNNNIDLGDKGLFAILKKTSKNLEYLFCANCSLSHEISCILKEKQENLHSLKFLNLRGNQSFTNKGFEILTLCPFFPNLKFLNLSDTGLDDEAIKIFMENKPGIGFPFHDLRLAQNRITPEALKVLFFGFQQDFKYLEKFEMGSYECMEEFEGKNEMEKKGVLVVGMIGDIFD